MACHLHLGPGVALQDIINGIGSTESLRKILSPYDDPRVLLVSGKNSFKLSGAKTAIDTALKNYKYTHFYDFQVNPQIEDVEEGVRIARSNGINLIVAIGGGSVLDMAKLIKACFDESHDVESIIKGLSVIVNPNIPLIAIPVTYYYYTNDASLQFLVNSKKQGM